MQPQVSDGNYYFTQEHEWIRFEDNHAFVGLTSLAKTELGQISDIEIHTIGHDLMEQQVFGRIRTLKYLCKLIMPVRGKIVEAHAIDYERFNTITKDVDPDEWIVRIEVSHPLITEKLYTIDQYKQVNAERALTLVKYFLRFGQ